MPEVGIALIGAGFIGDVHAEAIRSTPGARLVGVASRSAESAARLAQKYGVPLALDDYRPLIARDDVDVVLIACPNDLHRPITVESARRGKHVICEKPIAPSLADADAMIEACRAANVKLMYAEDLCFAPKYVRLKQLVDTGALGALTLVKQSEKHDGPHSEWFWDTNRSGGGVALDMGCHGIQFARWMLTPQGGSTPKVKSVSATLTTQAHGGKTRGDDNSIIILEFENGPIAMIEGSWSKAGGMDDRAEVQGTEGLAYADLLRGSSIVTYSKRGYEDAVEKAGTSVGWSFTMPEEAWNYGFPQEIAHFVSCVRDDRTPLVTGEDGRAVLEIIHAAYASAGQRRVIDLPFPSTASRPIDLWRG